MSILIKGMKMPKNCRECIWIQRGYPDWCDLPMGKDLYNDRKRQDWCPLVSVPTPHGRLIDADELEPDAEWSERQDDYIAYSKAQIINAPTIIEAEEE